MIIKKVLEARDICSPSHVESDDLETFYYAQGLGTGPPNHQFDGTEVLFVSKQHIFRLGHIHIRTSGKVASRLGQLLFGVDKVLATREHVT